MELNRLCLDDSGQERQGLTAREQQQVRSVSCSQPIMRDEGRFTFTQSHRLPRLQCLVLALRLARCQMGSLVSVQRIEPDCLRLLARGVANVGLGYGPHSRVQADFEMRATC